MPIICSDCKSVITDLNRPDCPQCGAFDRDIEIADSGVVTAHESMRLIEYRAGESKTKGKIRETTIGDSLHHDTGIWNHIHRVIDRSRDWYTEKITAPDGRIIKDCSEPLSEHQGHGSAKKHKQGQ